MVWEASDWDFTKKEGKKKRMRRKQNKCEEVCEPWNALCTAKFKEVMQAGCDAFAWQAREDTLAKPKGATFDEWLKPRQIALRPLLWEVCCDTYTHSKSSYEAAHGKPSAARLALVCFDSNSTRMAEARVEGARSATFLRDKE